MIEFMIPLGRGRDRTEHMIPGEGTGMDWATLRDALRKVKYDRFLTVELYTHTERPQEAAEKSYQFLSRFFGS